jgi:hypothetical protein
MRKRIRQRKSKAARMPRSDEPPILQCVTKTARIYRFEAANGQALHNITVGNLLAAMGNIAVTANGVSSMHSSVRIKYIKCYTSAQGVSTVASIVNWSSGIGNIADEKKERPSIPYGRIGVTIEKPPRGTLAGYWWPSADFATILFQIQCPIGTIVDIFLEGRLGNAFSNISTAITSTVTPSNIFYLPLDGPGATPVFVPMGVPTTN